MNPADLVDCPAGWTETDDSDWVRDLVRSFATVDAHGRGHTIDVFYDTETMYTAILDADDDVILYREYVSGDRVNDAISDLAGIVGPVSEVDQ